MNSEQKPAHEDHAKNHTNTETTSKGKTTPELAPAAGIPKTDLPPAPHSYQITCKTEKDWHDKVKFWIEIVGLGFLIAYTITTVVYACITHRMWIEMQTQTKIQRDTGINTVRAWVGLDVPITLDAIENQSARVVIIGHYSIKNFGHGPAFKVVQFGNFVGTNESMEIQTREANSSCDGPVKFATGTVPVGGEMKQPPPFGYVLFPDKWNNYPIQFQGPQDTVLHLRFIGCVAYIDQFKTVHWTRFCMERTPGDPARIPKLNFCAMYNDTDEPKK